MTIQNITSGLETLLLPKHAGHTPADEAKTPAADVAEISDEARAILQDTIGSADALPGQGDGHDDEAAENASAVPSVSVLGESADEVSEEDVAAAGLQGASGEVASEDGEDEDDTAVDDPASKSITGETLTDEDAKEVERLRERDREVRTHEQAHAAAGGSHVRGGIKYEYQTGPDGRRYAVGGEVSIDTSPVSGDPQKTIQKAQQVRRAAMAPAEPSGADRQAAAAASRMEAEARQELIEERANPEALEDEAATPSATPNVEATSEAPASAGVDVPEASDESPSLDGESSGLVSPSESDSTSPLSPESPEPSIDAPSFEPPEAGPEGLTELIEDIQDRAEDGASASTAQIVSLSYGARASEVGGLLDYTT
jgi:hypothetical protein